jgi:16S rRNA (guanine527-N7)-methyltransferase
VNGTFIAMKAASAQEELEQGKKAIDVLGGEISAIERFMLPIEQSERTIIFIQKVRNTPNKYPRKPGMPNKQPIQ